MQNLDLSCAQLAEELAKGAKKEQEKLLMDGLAVLQEQGLYAFFLFLKASKGGQDISNKCESFLRDQGLLQTPNDDLWKALQSLTGRLDDLLFARDLLLQALVYACYHAKAQIKGANRT